MKRLVLLLGLICISSAAIAQKADVSFVVGGSFVSDAKATFLGPTGPSGITTTVHTDHHIFLEGAFAVRLLNARVAALHVEVPVAGIPSQTVSAGTPSSELNHLSTVFVTPGIRLKLAPFAPISPWASIGGGWAHYSLGAPAGTQNKAALEYGGGIDFKTGFPLLGFRAEARDYVTNTPNSGLAGVSLPGGLSRHNVLLGGGVVVRF